MPLSENEQNILAEIERHLEATDPGLARHVGKSSVYRHALGSLKWSIAGFVVGMVVLVATLKIHYLIAFAGFLVMLVSALGFEHNLRMMGRAGIAQMSSAFRAANPPSVRRRADQVDED